MLTRNGSAYVYGDPGSYFYEQKTEEEIQAMKDRWKAKKEAEEDHRRKEQEKKEQYFLKIPEFVRDFLAENQPAYNVFKQEQRLFCEIGQREFQRKSSTGEEWTVTVDFWEYTYKKDEEILATVVVSKYTMFRYRLSLIKKNRKPKNYSVSLSVEHPIRGGHDMAFFYAVGYLAEDINNVVDPLLKAALFVYKYGTNSFGDCLENEYGVYTGWLLLPAKYITKEVLEFVKTKSVGTYEALRVKLELAA